MDFLDSLLVTVILILFPAWKIAEKAGFSPIMSFLVLIPGIGGIIYTAILAFATWPNGRKQEEQ